MSGPWCVLSQVIDGRRLYIAGRQLNLAQPLHGGNVEYSGGYTPDRDAVATLVSEDLDDLVIDLLSPDRDAVATLVSGLNAQGAL